LGIPLVAVAAGAMVAWRTKNVFLTILGGLAVFWIAKFAGF
jgi:branched-subunit amino acid transport protein